MDLILFGIQGSGKGTQAKKLVAEFGYRLFETGAALRAIAASGTPLGKQVKEIIDAGHHVSTEVVMDVVRAAISDCPPGTPMLFDGIPRNPEQQEHFDTLLKEEGRSFRGIEIIVDEEKAVQRILGRAKTEGRADDASEDSIRKRIALFHEKTEPVIETYRERGLVTEVDGEGDVEQVYQRLKQAIK